MVKSTRNNESIIKKSLNKTLQIIEKINESFYAKEKLKQREREHVFLLESLEKMSYTDLRKKAQEVGLPIYQRKKEDLKIDLRNYYEQLRSETHQLF